MSDDELRRCKTKCSKCKSRDLVIKELGTSCIYHYCNAGLIDESESYTSMTADGGRVEAECSKCGHEWRVRGAATLHGVLEDL